MEMFNDENNRPRGCAIIEFDSNDLVNKAIDVMHRHELKGRKLVVKEVSNFILVCLQPVYSIFTCEYEKNR